MWWATAGYTKRVGMALLGFAWLELCVEYLSRGSLTETLRWTVTRWPAFLLSCLLGGLLLAGLTFLLAGGRTAYVVVAGFCLTAAYVSGVKLRILGLPLVPWDFLQLGEARDVASGNGLVNLPATGALLLFAAGSVWILRHLALKAGWAVRAAVAGASLGLVVVVAALLLAAGARQDWAADPARNVRENGFLLATLYNLSAVSPHRGPATPQAVQALAPVHTPPAGPPAPAGPRPNIIVVLSETFWDPTRLTEVSFGRDPMPTYHALRDKYSSGWMLSPVFGGGTANVEFEVLTGLTTRFLPGGSIAYNQYVDRPIDSLASVLARQGYSATAVSPWPNWFFHSNQAYRNLGFARFISQEFMPEEYSGPYIPDRVVADIIMAETRKSPGPDFIFANTAENHQPYPKDKFPANTIQVSGVSGEARDMLETFAQGCANADQMLKQLVDYYSNSSEPTIIVWFGDHLPTLGAEYMAYRAAGYVTGETDPAWLEKMYRVPLLVWNNYLPDQKDRLDISPFYVGPYLLHLAQLPGTPFTDFLREQSERIPVLPPRHRWADFHVAEADVQAYQTLEEDILFGEQHTYGDQKERIVDPTFALGYGPLTVESATVEASTITLRGANLPPRGVVFQGGKPLPTRWADGALVGTIPPELYAAGEMEVEVRVTDRENTVLAKSIPVMVTLP